MPENTRAKAGDETRSSPAHLPPAVTGAEFANLAARTLAAARLFVEFRDQREVHRLWAEELSATVPVQLRETVAAYESAQRTASEARWHLKRAREGAFYGGSMDRFGGNRALAILACQAAYDLAAARLKKAKDAAQQIAGDYALASNAIIRRKLADLGVALRGLAEKFAAAVGEHELPLAKMTQTIVDVGGWKGPSHCSVLVDLSRALLELVESESGRSSCLSTVSLAKRLGLEREVWDTLGIAVLKEAALLPSPRASGRRLHAAGTLDERALRLAKAWQKAERAWTVTELAAELSTTRANLTGKRGGKPRCPLFSEFWDGVQTQRAAAKMRRQA